MARKQLIATGPLRYGTRMLSAGEGLTVNGPTARLLEALGKARGGAVRGRSEATRETSKATGDDIAALRTEYQAKLNKRPFNGWDAATLREKIAAAS